MARIRTPAISFGASGKLAKTLIFSKWKGKDVAREYVVPSDPRTPDQTAHRGVFTAVVNAWRSYLTDTDIRAAWNLLASSAKKPMSGFNRAIQSMLPILTADPDAAYSISFFVAATETAFDMRDMDDGGPPSEAGSFDIWRGTSPTSLLFSESQPLVATTVTASTPGASGDVWYVELRKTGGSRSGIAKITVP